MSFLIQIICNTLKRYSNDIHYEIRDAEGGYKQLIILIPENYADQLYRFLDSCIKA